MTAGPMALMEPSGLMYRPSTGSRHNKHQTGPMYICPRHQTQGLKSYPSHGSLGRAPSVGAPGDVSYRSNLMTPRSARPPSRSNHDIQMDLKDRVYSIERTLEKYGSRASFGSGHAPGADEHSLSNGVQIPAYRPYKHLKSHHTHTTPNGHRKRSSGSHGSSKHRHGKDSEDEEIEKLFKDLEKLSKGGFERSPSPRKSRSNTPNQSHLVPHSASHSHVYHEHPAGSHLPCLFRCKGCGELQPIYTPNDPILGQLSVSRASAAPSPYPGALQNLTGPPPYSNNTTLQSGAPGGAFQIPTPGVSGHQGSQIVIMPYFMGQPPSNPTTAAPNSEKLEEVLKSLADNLPNLQRRRSIGTQSVEDLHSNKNLDETEDEEAVVAKAGGGGELHSAAPGLDFGDWDEEETGPESELPKTAAELRELELQAWAGAKWWNLVRQRQIQREQRAMDVDFEDFCRAEFPNREKLHSAQNDLDFIDTELEKPQETVPKEAEKHNGPTDGNTAANNGGLPHGFSSFKSLSATANASFKWTEMVEKNRKKREERANAGK